MKNHVLLAILLFLAVAHAQITKPALHAITDISRIAAIALPALRAYPTARVALTHLNVKHVSRAIT
jgi:hypothetical protein